MANTATTKIVKAPITVSFGSGGAGGGATVQCPAGSRLTGGGVEVKDPKFAVLGSRPSDGGEGWAGWIGSSRNYVDGIPPREGGTVYAVCQVDG